MADPPEIDKFKSEQQRRLQSIVTKIDEIDAFLTETLSQALERPDAAQEVLMNPGIRRQLTRAVQDVVTSVATYKAKFEVDVKAVLERLHEAVKDKEEVLASAVETRKAAEDAFNQAEQREQRAEIQISVFVQSARLLNDALEERGKLVTSLQKSNVTLQAEKKDLQQQLDNLQHSIQQQVRAAVKIERERLEVEHKTQTEAAETRLQQEMSTELQKKKAALEAEYLSKFNELFEKQSAANDRADANSNDLKKVLEVVGTYLAEVVPETSGQQVVTSIIRTSVSDAVASTAPMQNATNLIDSQVQQTVDLIAANATTIDAGNLMDLDVPSDAALDTSSDESLLLGPERSRTPTPVSRMPDLTLARQHDVSSPSPNHRPSKRLHLMHPKPSDVASSIASLPLRAMNMGSLSMGPVSSFPVVDRPGDASKAGASITDTAKAGPPTLPPKADKSEPTLQPRVAEDQRMRRMLFREFYRITGLLNGVDKIAADVPTTFQNVETKRELRDSLSEEIDNLEAFPDYLEDDDLVDMLSRDPTATRNRARQSLAVEVHETLKALRDLAANVHQSIIAFEVALIPVCRDWSRRLVQAYDEATQLDQNPDSKSLFEALDTMEGALANYNFHSAYVRTSQVYHERRHFQVLLDADALPVFKDELERLRNLATSLYPYTATSSSPSVAQDPQLVRRQTSTPSRDAVQSTGQQVEITPRVNLKSTRQAVETPGTVVAQPLAGNIADTPASISGRQPSGSLKRKAPHYSVPTVSSSSAAAPVIPSTATTGSTTVADPTTPTPGSTSARRPIRTAVSARSGVDTSSTSRAPLTDKDGGKDIPEMQDWRGSLRREEIEAMLDSTAVPDRERDHWNDRLNTYFTLQRGKSFAVSVWNMDKHAYGPVAGNPPPPRFNQCIGTSQPRTGLEEGRPDTEFIEDCYIHGDNPSKIDRPTTKVKASSKEWPCLYLEFAPGVQLPRVRDSESGNAGFMPREEFDADRQTNANGIRWVVKMRVRRAAASAQQGPASGQTFGQASGLARPQSAAATGLTPSGRASATLKHSKSTNFTSQIPRRK